MVVYGPPTGTVGPVRITLEAYRALETYAGQHPARIAAEEKETGKNPVQDPDGYFSIELSEPQHADVLERVRTCCMVLGITGFVQWTREEDLEPDHQPHRPPAETAPPIGFSPTTAGVEGWGAPTTESPYGIPAPPVTFHVPERHTSICPECHREFEATGTMPNEICAACIHRSATWAAPAGERYPGSPFYPGGTG